MRQPEIFGAFIFQLPKSHLFQHTVITALHDSDVRQCNFSDNDLQVVIEVVYQFLLPKFIDDCNRLLPDWQIQRDA